VSTKRKPWTPKRKVTRGLPAKPRVVEIPTEMRRGSGRAPNQVLVPKLGDDIVMIKIPRRLGDSVMAEFAPSFYARYRTVPTNDGIINYALSFHLGSATEVTTSPMFAVLVTPVDDAPTIVAACLTERAAFEELRSAATTYAYLKGEDVTGLRCDEAGVFRVLGREFRLLRFKLTR
jgi:hypothetical protein